MVTSYGTIAIILLLHDKVSLVEHYLHKGNINNMIINNKSIAYIETKHGVHETVQRGYATSIHVVLLPTYDAIQLRL